MKIEKSEVRLSEEEFNEMPGRANIMELIDAVFNQNCYEVVDIVEGREYWKNNDDTLIIAVDREVVWQLGAKGSFNVALFLAQMIWQISVYEFQNTEVQDKMILRFWWD